MTLLVLLGADAPTVAMSWNGVTLPYPAAYPISYTQVGGKFVTASGAQMFDFMAQKRRIGLKWEGITTAQKDSIVTLATAFTSASLVLSAVGGPTLNVIPQDDLQIDAFGVTPAWNVTVTVRET